MNLSAIVPADYPELARLAWNRDPRRPITGEEALSLYEANWRHIDPCRFDAAERALVAALVQRYAGGLPLTAG